MSNIDIEEATKSWHKAPDEHLSLAIKTIENYDPQVRTVIIEEAKNRFGNNFLTETIDDCKQKVASNSVYVGMRRKDYFLTAITFCLLLGAIALIAKENETIILILKIISYPISLALTFYRLKNIGYNGWWALLALVPILCLFVYIPCIVLPEKYKYTHKIDTAGKIISIILIGLLAFVVIGMILGIILFLLGQ